MFPPCFDSQADYDLYRAAWLHEDWLYQDANAVRLPQPSGYCTDCTFVFQAQMLKECRCNYPGVEFVTAINEDGDLETVGQRKLMAVARPKSRDCGQAA